MNQQECVIIVDRVSINCNYQFINGTLNLFNDGIHDSVINGAIQTFVVMEKVTAHCKIRVPSNEYDQQYQKVLYQSSINLEKFYKGVTGNFLVKLFADALIAALSTKPVFPIPKVI
jgi:hypothetical protein